MFTPHTESEREEMLQTIGVKKIEDLFQDVPEEFRFLDLDLPPALSEMEAQQYIQDLSLENETTTDLICFLGAGAYNHYTPAAVDSIIRRGEFLTAYTPYQPEVSQGTLQAIFEYQSLIVALTGMEVCNASHYDGATATAEAAVLAHHQFRGKRKKYILSPTIHPDYRATLRTYMGGIDDLSIIGDEEENVLSTNPNELASLIDKDTAMVAVQYPDFLGRIFDYTELAKVT
ncbi:MAG: glycine dehydrogenase, partial [Anaerolineaceae bacterium]|nr:glycine dehydrogenase [Anaerolineaceae bacterium]